MKTLGSIIVVLLIGMTSYAQKVAHINTDELVALMPEKMAADNELMKTQQELEVHLANMITELDEIYTDIQKNRDKWTPVILRMKEAEMDRIRVAIEEFKIVAQDELTKRELELYAPIISKAKEAINKVADEEGYQYVIDSSAGSLLVMPETHDIIKLVQKELGIIVLE